MHTFFKRALLGAVLGGGLAVAGAAVANAAETDGADGLLSGTQAVIEAVVPVTVGGNAVSVIGDSTSSGADTSAAPTTGSGGDAASTSGADATGSGTQALVSVDVPVAVAGTSVSVVGDSASEGAATGTVPVPETPAVEVAAITDGVSGVLSGTQALVEVAVPVTVTGNSVAVVGDSASTDATAPQQPAETDAATTPAPVTDGADGVASGTQVVAPVQAPVTVGGNAVSVLGDSTSDGASVTAPAAGGPGAPVTDGAEGTLGGSQIVLPIALPITVGGNAISIVGDSTTTETGTTPGADPGTDPTDPGTDPTDPGTTPTEPGTEPTDPGTTPTDPGTDPTGPGATPTEPGAVPGDSDPAATSGTGTPGDSSGFSGGIALPATDATLARTGVDVSGPALLAALLLTAGLLALGARRMLRT